MHHKKQPDDLNKKCISKQKKVIFGSHERKTQKNMKTEKKGLKIIFEIIKNEEENLNDNPVLALGVITD